MPDALNPLPPLAPAQRWTRFLNRRIDQHPGLGATDVEVRSWLGAVDRDGDPVEMVEADRWMRLGFRTPQQRPEGLDFDDVEILRAAGVEGLHGDWNLVRHLCPEQVRFGLAAGRDPGQIVDLFAALPNRLTRYRDDPCLRHEGPVGCDWSETSVAASIEVATAAAGIADWGDVADCLLANMAPAEALAYVAEGRDMAPVLLLLALGDD